MEPIRIVLGYKGQVGSAICSMIRDSRGTFFGIEKNQKDYKEIENLHGGILHCCIPYSDGFIETLGKYISELKPVTVIIHSTVIPGTTTKLYARFKRKIQIYFSPCRGQHNSLLNDFIRYRKFLAAPYPLSISAGKDELNLIGFRTRVVQPIKALELAKLLDTTQYAVLIAWAHEAERFCKAVGGDFDLLKEFGVETQKFYSLRPSIYPGVIGGHCLMPNVILLQKLRKSGILEFIEESNKAKQKQGEVHNDK